MNVEIFVLQGNPAWFDYFDVIESDAVRDAWADAFSRDPGWRKRALEARKILLTKAPELVQALLSI